MSTVHFLNVGNGDCTLIQHGSGRVSMIDICKGNYAPPQAKTLAERINEQIDVQIHKGVLGNFHMADRPTNPLFYLKGLGISSIFRFILTHPDMDHMDGINALMGQFTPTVFWETGVRRDKPEFGDVGPYLEADWDRYAKMCDKKEPGLTVLNHLADARFPFANQNEDKTPGGDGLYILAPDKGLVEAANADGDMNDGSYMLLYRSPGGKILIPGDAHDDTWEYVKKHHAKDIANCAVLFAPHHGRHSDANFDYLDIINPVVTLFGCAPSEHLAYEQWSRRGLTVVTNNQAGNVVLECTDGIIQMYVENEVFAKKFRTDRGWPEGGKNGQGYSLLLSVNEPAAKVA